MIQKLKVSSIRIRSLKINGPTCEKDEEAYHIEDYYEWSSLSLKSEHEERKHAGFNCDSPRRVRGMVIFCQTRGHWAMSQDIFGGYNLESSTASCEQKPGKLLST